MREMHETDRDKTHLNQQRLCTWSTSGKSVVGEFLLQLLLLPLEDKVYLFL